MPPQHHLESSEQEHAPKQSFFLASTRLVSQTTSAKKNVMLHKYSMSVHMKANMQKLLRASRDESIPNAKAMHVAREVIVRAGPA